MGVNTIAGIILAVSIGCYALHLYLVFRQIRRQTSDLNYSSSQGTIPDLPESAERMHKIVHSAAGPEEEFLDEKDTKQE